MKHLILEQLKGILPYHTADNLANQILNCTNNLANNFSLKDYQDLIKSLEAFLQSPDVLRRCILHKQDKITLSIRNCLLESLSTDQLERIDMVNILKTLTDQLSTCGNVQNNDNHFSLDNIVAKLTPGFVIDPIKTCLEKHLENTRKQIEQVRDKIIDIILKPHKKDIDETFKHLESRAAVEKEFCHFYVEQFVNLLKNNHVQLQAVAKAFIQPNFNMTNSFMESVVIRLISGNPLDQNKRTYFERLGDGRFMAACTERLGLVFSGMHCNAKTVEPSNDGKLKNNLEEVRQNFRSISNGVPPTMRTSPKNSPS